MPRSVLIEPKLDDAQYGFRADRSTTDQIFALQKLFVKSWEYPQDI